MLSNILIEVKKSKIKITATDLDIIYFEQIMPQEVKKEGSTTTSASMLNWLQMVRVQEMPGTSPYRWLTTLM